MGVGMSMMKGWGSWRGTPPEKGRSITSSVHSAGRIGMKMKKAKSFTQKELLELANEAYDDGYLANYYTQEGKLKKNGSGDTLAKFIVIELIETFDAKQTKKQQLYYAAQAIERAKEQLWDLQGHLEEAHDAL